MSIVSWFMRRGSQAVDYWYPRYRFSIETSSRSMVDEIMHEYIRRGGSPLHVAIEELPQPTVEPTRTEG